MHSQCAILQQGLINKAKTETKKFDIKYLNSDKNNQQFWYRYNKLTGNKTINIECWASI